jgi:hypothetical protein
LGTPTVKHAYPILITTFFPIDHLFTDDLITKVFSRSIKLIQHALLLRRQNRFDNTIVNDFFIISEMNLNMKRIGCKINDIGVNFTQKRA